MKLPRYVHGFVGRHGKARYYFRRSGFKQVRLRGVPWSADFMEAYEAALNGTPPIVIGESRTLAGTVDALVVSYYKSADWSQLKPDSQKKRRRIIERFRAQHGNKRVALLRRDHIQTMLAEIGKLWARRDWLIAIRGLMQSAVPSMRQDDPTAGIASIRLPRSKGHHAWTDDEIEQYRAYWPLGTQQRLVMEFALETASRRGEVVRLGPQHVKNGRIRIERTHGSRDVDIPMSAELQAACDAMPKAHLTYVVSPAGKPRSKYALGRDFRKWATAAGVPKRCRLHGLKKGGMRRLAEVGNTTHELMAISGHKTLSMVQHYTADADRKRLATSGMAKRQTENKQVAHLQSPGGTPAQKPAKNGD